MPSSTGIYLRLPPFAPRPAATERAVGLIERELALRAASRRPDAVVESVYVEDAEGGAPDEVMLGALRAVETWYTLAEEPEITVRLSPEAVLLERLRTWRAYGVNRLSVEAQSFFGEDLERIGARHTAEQVAAAVEAAQAADLTNLSLDLMLGLPGQPIEYWGASLQRAIGAAVPHLYLQEPDAERPPAGPPPFDEDTLAERYTLAVDLLTRADYEVYEISYFARPGFRSVHNQKYWDHSDAIGVGPGAHGFTWHGGSQADRWVNEADPDRYAALLERGRLPVAAVARLNLFDLADEYVMLRLRTADGLDLETLEQRYGVDLLSEKPDELAWLERDGLIRPIHNGLVRLTPRGRLVCNAVTARLVS